MIEKIKNSNFFRLFTAVFFSELGGYLTNTVILIHLFKITDGSKFYLGLAQILFVGPLALGTIVGGYMGEIYNRRKIMILCEVTNLILVATMIFHPGIWSIIFLRGIIVFFAGIYNPSRQAMVQDIVEPSHLRYANAAFTSTYAILHSVGPILGAVLYKHFGRVEEIFTTNIITYIVGASLVYKIKYYPSEKSVAVEVSPKTIFKGIYEGFQHLFHRDDLFTILKNFSIAGICLGVFYPSLLPFLSEAFKSDEVLYGRMLLAFGLGGIFGGAFSALALRYFRKGRILVLVALIQPILFFLWTQTRQIELSYLIIFAWGISTILLISTYINYVQVNVASSFQSRTFSVYDQSVSLSVVIGAAIVLLVGDNISSATLLTITSITAFALLFLQLFSRGVRTLFYMET